MDHLNNSDLFCIKDNIIIGSKTEFQNEKKQNCINIGDLILKSFISNPNFIGQVHGKTGEEHTFQQMREKTVKCALWMQKAGVQPSNVIMICTNNQLDAYVPFLAALYIGAVVSPLDIYYNLDMIDIFVEQVNPVMLFVNEKNYKIVNEKINQLQILNNNPTPIIIAFNNKKKKQTTNEDLLTLEKIMNHNYEPFNIENFFCTKVTDMDSLAMRLFTPGTTAFPVQVGIPHFAFLAPSDQQAPNMRKNDTALLCESLCYINGIFMTIQAILLHVKVIRIKSRFTAQNICETIEKYKVTWVFFETNTCNRLVKSGELEKHDFSSLRTIVFGGSATNSEQIHNNLRILLPNTNILQIYSLTETGIIAYQRQPGKSGSCGYVSANVQLKLVAVEPSTIEDDLSSPEQIGEIYCISPYMTSFLKYNSEEYLGWLKTGDLGYYDKDGDIFIVDRINQLFRVEKGFFRIIPTVIETLLLSHDAVLEAIVIPVPIDNNDQYSVAFIKKKPGVEVTEMEIKQFLKQNYFCPHELRRMIFIRIKIWPCHSNGKINRRMILNMVHSTAIWKYV